MATNRIVSIRFKTELSADTETKSKLKVDLKGRRFRSGQEVTLPEAEAKSFVEAGLADYLDPNGNVIFEEHTKPVPSANPEESGPGSPDAGARTTQPRTTSDEEKTPAKRSTKKADE